VLYSFSSNMTFCTFISISFARLFVKLCLGQETAKWPLRSSNQAVYDLNKNKNSLIFCSPFTTYHFYTYSFSCTADDVITRWFELTKIESYSWVEKILISNHVIKASMTTSCRSFVADVKGSILGFHFADRRLSQL